MRFLLFLILLSGITRSQAQFAFISDKDGYANIRKTPANGKNVLTSLSNGHLVYITETNGTWTSIIYTKNGKEQTGFIYNDRVKMIAGYDLIPTIESDEHNILCQKDSVKIVVRTQPFNKANYRITYRKENPHLLQAINGYQAWGVDGNLPSTEYKSIQVQIGNRKMELPRTALSQFFEPSLENTRIQYDRRQDILYIESVNSDGAGHYAMILKIERGVYVERLAPYYY